MTDIIRFRFPDQSPSTPEEVEADICLAVFSAECIHGHPKVRRAFTYRVDPSGLSCTLQVQSEAGETALHVFIGLCGERFGEAGFQMESGDAEDGKE